MCLLNRRAALAHPSVATLDDRRVLLAVDVLDCILEEQVTREDPVAQLLRLGLRAGQAATELDQPLRCRLGRAVYLATRGNPGECLLGIPLTVADSTGETVLLPLVDPLTRDAGGLC